MGAWCHVICTFGPWHQWYKFVQLYAKYHFTAFLMHDGNVKNVIFKNKKIIYTSMVAEFGLHCMVLVQLARDFCFFLSLVAAHKQFLARAQWALALARWFSSFRVVQGNFYPDFDDPCSSLEHLLRFFEVCYLFYCYLICDFFAICVTMFIFIYREWRLPKKLWLGVAREKNFWLGVAREIPTYPPPTTPGGQ